MNFTSGIFPSKTLLEKIKQLTRQLNYTDLNSLVIIRLLRFNLNAVPNPDLEAKGGRVSPQKLFRPFGPHNLVPRALFTGFGGRSALFNICRKALGHLMKFTQRSIPYRFGLAV